MTVDEAIERLKELREEVGGDAPVCLQSEETPSGRVAVMKPAAFETLNVVDVDCGDGRQHWVCLRNGNNTRVVWVF